MTNTSPSGTAARRQPSATRPTPRMVAAFRAFLDGEASSAPFRRADVGTIVYPMTTPRDRARASALAAALIADAAKAGHLMRDGHLHWMRTAPGTERRLRSGRLVLEASAPLALSLTTRCPAKWASVDLETGEVWIGSADGWRRASAEIREEVRSCA